MLTFNKEITQMSYQITAEEFTRNVSTLAPVESIEKFLSMIGPKAKILDLGSGSGRDAKLFTEKGIDVLGVDFSSHLIKIAKETAPLAHFQLQDMETLQLPSSSFDGVWAGMSLCHIPKENLPTMLNMISHVLKNQGYFYLSLKKGSGELLEKDMRYSSNVLKFWSYYTEEEITEFLSAAGFKILELSLVKKNHSYQTQNAIRAFCQKNP